VNYAGQWEKWVYVKHDYALLDTLAAWMHKIV